MANSGGAGWKDEDAAAALDERLGPARDRVLDIVMSIHRSIAKFLFKMVHDKPKLQEKLKEHASSAVCPTRLSRSGRTELTARPDKTHCSRQEEYHPLSKSATFSSQE